MKRLLAIILGAFLFSGSVFAQQNGLSWLCVSNPQSFCPVSLTYALPVQISGGRGGSSATPLFAQLTAGSATIGAVNQAGAPWAVTAAQSGSWTVNSVQSGLWNVGVIGTVAVTGTTVPVGSAGTPNAAVVTVQGITGGTALPISQSPSASSGIGILPVVSGSASSSLILKASGGNLYNISATCTAACWLFIYNSATVPADGATTAGTGTGNLQECLPIAAGTNGSIRYNSGPPEVFSAGITAVISSTSCATQTSSAVGFIHASVQ